MLASIASAYDKEGNKLTMTEEHGVTSYQYDAVYRLVHVEYQEILVTSSKKNKSSSKGKGNKNGHEEVSDSLPTSVFYVYDAACSRLTKTDDYATVMYFYNSAYPLLQAGESTYIYDTNGNRIAKQDEEGTSLYHFHFRQYDANVGGWTTADPIGVIGGVNLYQYVENYPLNLRDWLGLWSGMGGRYDGDLGDAREVEGPGSHHDTTPGEDDGGMNWDPNGNWSYSPYNEDRRKAIKRTIQFAKERVNQLAEAYKLGNSLLTNAGGWLIDGIQRRRERGTNQCHGQGFSDEILQTTEP